MMHVADEKNILDQRGFLLIDERINDGFLVSSSIYRDVSKMENRPFTQQVSQRNIEINFIFIVSHFLVPGEARHKFLLYFPSLSGWFNYVWERMQRELDRLDSVMQQVCKKDPREISDSLKKEKGAFLIHSTIKRKMASTRQYLQEGKIKPKRLYAIFFGN